MFAKIDGYFRKISKVDYNQVVSVRKIARLVTSFDTINYSPSTLTEKKTINFHIS